MCIPCAKQRHGQWYDTPSANAVPYVYADKAMQDEMAAREEIAEKNREAKMKDDRQIKLKNVTEARLSTMIQALYRGHLVCETAITDAVLNTCT